MGNSEESILRAKYLDWCSARIAERFLALSPDEIYQLAERASSGQANTADPLPPLSPFSLPNTQPDWHAAVRQAVTSVAEPDAAGEAAAFRQVIARVTGVLADEMELPTFEEWSAAYSEAPEEFDGDLLGFWRDEQIRGAV